jgi:shikimate dehydrogenase
LEQLSLTVADDVIPQTAPDRYAVVGNPVAHSKSPLIHQAFAQQCAQNIRYERILAPLDGFKSSIADLIMQGYKGVNITVPFKLEAFALVTTISERARAAGAVNTMIFNAGEIYGDNTDGAGLVRDIEHNLHTAIAGKRILLIGAGGAAEGVLQPLLAAAPSLLVITNRSVDKAHSMAKKAATASLQALDVRACGFDALGDLAFDIVINATSTGLSDSQLPLPATIFGSECLAYDMMYGRETPFMAFARSHGARVCDGLGMLLEQAAEAFYLWRGVRPQTQAVMQALRQLSAA